MAKPSNALECRSADSADVADLGGFIRAEWAAAGPGGLGFAGANDAVIDDLAQPDTLRSIIADADTSIFIAVEDGHIAGFAAARRVSGDTAELSGIIVAHDRAGRGIGSMLVAHAVIQAQKWHSGRMIVGTESHNRPAIEFYEARGFSGRRPVTESVGHVTVDVVELAMAVPTAAHDRGVPDGQ